MRPTWDDYFLQIAEAVKTRSIDKSQQIGAVITGPHHDIRSTGYNSFPRGCQDHLSSRQERPLKYKWFEHAERNAIYNAARVGVPLDGCTIYIGSKMLPCSDCARAIVAVGINRIVLPVEVYAIPERWLVDMVQSITILEETGIIVTRPNFVENMITSIQKEINERASNFLNQKEVHG